jgi:hypothetical protein
MRRRSLQVSAWVLAAGFLIAAPSCFAQSDHQAQLEQYIRARQAFDEVASGYWRSVAEKRSLRSAKRRNNEPITLDDYVLTQPPVYSGPPRPPGPGPDPTEQRRPEIPTIADFIRNAAEQFGFVPNRPANEMAFKRAYAQAAKNAGLTKEQVVGIYAFETGGNGTYDIQSGVSPLRPGSRPISPALGYNQLLSTNTVGLLAEHGDRYVAALRRKAASLNGEAKTAMERKIEALRRMIALSRSVPYSWSEHDRMAKTTPGGIGIHAAVLDLDLGPLLQVQKLAGSVRFARSKGYRGTMTAAELELMNFTGDGNGIDMILMPPEMRPRVPTANFFQQQGYERNPIARRTGVVAELIASIEGKMNQAAQAQGARDMAAAFAGVTN